MGQVHNEWNSGSGRPPTPPAGRATARETAPGGTRTLPAQTWTPREPTTMAPVAAPPPRTTRARLVVGSAAVLALAALFTVVLVTRADDEAGDPVAEQGEPVSVDDIASLAPGDEISCRVVDPASLTGTAVFTVVQFGNAFIQCRQTAFATPPTTVPR